MDLFTYKLHFFSQNGDRFVIYTPNIQDKKETLEKVIQGVKAQCWRCEIIPFFESYEQISNDLKEPNAYLHFTTKWCIFLVIPKENKWSFRVTLKRARCAHIFRFGDFDSYDEMNSFLEKTMKPIAEDIPEDIKPRVEITVARISDQSYQIAEEFKRTIKNADDDAGLCSLFTGL